MISASRKRFKKAVANVATSDREWTNNDDKRLEGHVFKGEELGKIARDLGRSRDAVYQRMETLDLLRFFAQAAVTLPQNAPNYNELWSERELRELERLYRERESWSSIARHFGRTETAAKIQVSNIRNGNFIKQRFLGKHPCDGNGIWARPGINGLGPYISHKRVNVPLPSEEDPNGITLGRALRLLSSKGSR